MSRSHLHIQLWELLLYLIAYKISHLGRHTPVLERQLKKKLDLLQTSTAWYRHRIVQVLLPPHTLLFTSITCLILLIVWQWQENYFTSVGSRGMFSWSKLGVNVKWLLGWLRIRSCTWFQWTSFVTTVPTKMPQLVFTEYGFIAQLFI